MKRFRTALFNGYKKAEVDTYIDTMTREHEREKAELAGKLSEMEKTIKALKAELAREKTENAGLIEEKNRTDKENAEKCEAMEKKIAEHEKNQEVLASLLVDTRIETERLLSAARRNADTMISQAEAETREAKTKAQTAMEEAEAEAKRIIDAAKLEAQRHGEEQEREFARRRDEEQKRSLAVKEHFEMYAGAFGGLRGRLEEICKELEALAGRMPNRLDEMLPEELLELFEDEPPKEEEKLCPAKSKARVTVEEA